MSNIAMLKKDAEGKHLIPEGYVWIKSDARKARSAGLFCIPAEVSPGRTKGVLVCLHAANEKKKDHWHTIRHCLARIKEAEEGIRFIDTELEDQSDDN